MGSNKKYFLLMIVFVISCWPIYGKIITEQKVTASSLTLQFKNEVGMLSHDGAEAQIVKSGTVITKPGTYYLSLYSKGKLEGIRAFVINKKMPNSYNVTDEKQVVEYLRDAQMQYDKTLTLTFPYTLSNEAFKQILRNAMDTVQCENPMLMTTSNAMTTCYIESGKNKTVAKLNLSYPLTMTENLRRYTDNSKRRLNTIVEERVKIGMTDYEIEQVLFQAVLDELKYSSTQENVINATSLSHNIQGALNQKLAVCDGYAKTLMYLNNMVGVPTKMVVGQGTSEGQTENHAWNLVKIQGNYYHVDSTWADESLSTKGAYPYFNDLDSYMKASHTWNEGNYPKAECKDFTLPFTPLKLKNNYKVNDGNQLNKAISQLMADGSQVGSFMFNNQSMSVEDVMNCLSRETQRPLKYRSEEKYDTTIVYFELK